MCRRAPKGTRFALNGFSSNIWEFEKKCNTESEIFEKTKFAAGAASSNAKRPNLKRQIGNPAAMRVRKAVNLGFKEKRDCLVTEMRFMKRFFSAFPLFLFIAPAFFPAAYSLRASEANHEFSIKIKYKAEDFVLIKETKSYLPPFFDVERQVFELINLKRSENGLPPLVWNEKTAGVARLHSANMAQFKFFSHRGLDGKTVDKRADSLGLKRWRMIGENIAALRGYREPLSQVVECWMRSPGHRANLLRENWRESGIGVAVAPDGTYYFTQVFLRK